MSQETPKKPRPAKRATPRDQLHAMASMAYNAEQVAFHGLAVEKQDGAVTRYLPESFGLERDELRAVRQVSLGLRHAAQGVAAMSFDPALLQKLTGFAMKAEIFYPQAGETAEDFHLATPRPPDATEIVKPFAWIAGQLNKHPASWSARVSGSQSESRNKNNGIF